MPGEIVRYGLISTAQIGLNAHVPAARESANSEIAAISSRDEAKARKAAAKHGIPRWYGTYEGLLADPDLDAVVNTLPNSMHCEWTIKAAEAGKHILCEKPLAVTMAEARRMIEAARANGVLLVEAFTHRWNPQMRRVREMITGGVLGEVTSLESVLTFPLRDWKNDVRIKPELAGGSLMDAGCYPLYAVRFVMGAEPVRVTAIARSKGDRGVDTTFSGLLEFPTGAVAHITSSLEQSRRCTLEVIGTDGQVSVLNMFNEDSPTVITTDDGRRTEEMSGPGRFRVQFDDFSECVLTGRAPEFPAEDGLRNTAALVALLTSASTGVVEEVEQG
ncbi:MAG: Gfo/Idh/MocA family oxidoreductase [Chloroflexi bacterium]|nr:Gfo/Idh/MocA family oxidoreductase [Chloroflexota bacterium]